MHLLSASPRGEPRANVETLQTSSAIALPTEALFTFYQISHTVRGTCGTTTE